jgi:hypothetical protein
LDGEPETARGFDWPFEPETTGSADGKPESGVIASPRPFAANPEPESARRVEAKAACELTAATIPSVLGEIGRDSGLAVAALEEFDSPEVLVEREEYPPFVSEDAADEADFAV